MPEIKRILFPVDFSLPCLRTAGAVSSMAARFDAELTLLHAFQTPLDDVEGQAHGEAAERFHRALAERLNRFAAEALPGVNVEKVILNAKPVAAIAACAEQRRTDLIMMPTHGHTRFRSLLLGSVTLGVLHDAACPVWTTIHAEGSQAPVGYRTIVCAIDLGSRTVEILEWAKMLAEQWRATLAVLHSVPAVDQRFESAVATRAHQYLVWSAKEQYPDLAARAQIEQPLEVLETAGLVESIVEAARVRQADLLVLGRGVMRGFLGRLRSNVHALIRSSPCPVVSV